MQHLVSLASANIQYLVILVLPFFTGMLWDFFQPGMIFSFYGDFLFKEERAGQDMPAWKKPIGGCLKCFHVWICFIWIAWLSLFGYEFNIIKYILALSVSYYILQHCYYK